MAFRPLRNAASGTQRNLATDTLNGTESLTVLPTHLLDLFLPGYSPIVSFANQILGLDVTYLVSLCLTIFGFAVATRYAVGLLSGLCKEEQNVTKQCTRLTVRARSHSEERKLPMGADISPTGHFNYKFLQAKLAPRYLPARGQHWFWHRHRWFSYDRYEKEIRENGWAGTRRETMLSCFGRSTQPIKDLLEEIQAWCLNREETYTFVHRPSRQDPRKPPEWDSLAGRQARPIGTIAFDHEKMQSLLQDLGEYLHPLTARWYVNRGIPLRRGYLFTGPPGTGKTSLAFSIAGHFGLDIYCVSLLDPSLTEEQLVVLFSDLPYRCIALLEDIDSAGLSRSGESPTSGQPTTDASDGENDDDSRDSRHKNKGGISLSGLLNVIDGVASHEGRVLMMTSNHPEKLDPALVRPGRVDMLVEFTLATRSQIEDLFMRMYKPNPQDEPVGAVFKADASESVTLDDKGGAGDDMEMSYPDFSALAQRFADALPPSKLSPAEVQGYLLKHKGDPERAVNGAAEWRDEVMRGRG